MTTTAIGKCLAYSEHLQRSIRKQYSLEDFTLIEKEIHTINQNGYALDIESYEPDLKLRRESYFLKKKICCGTMCFGTFIQV